jgi:hypothetical protein
MSFDGLWSSVIKLLLMKKSLGVCDSQAYILAFGIGCYVVAIFFMVLDLCNLHVRRRSFLTLRYEGYNWCILFLTWPLAAAITGMLGLSLDILQPTVAGCIGAGLSWHFILAMVIGRVSDGDEVDIDRENEE